MGEVHGGRRREVGATRWRSIAVALFALTILGPLAERAAAYDVEADTVANSIYVLLWNGDPAADFTSVAIAGEPPAFVSGLNVTLVPTDVPASGSDLASLAFDVAPGAVLGTTGDIRIDVSGTSSGQVIAFELIVPLEVVATAPDAQGVVGEGVPAPDPGGVDTDGDGVTDALEIAFGSDPFDSASMPGKSVAKLPALGTHALGALAVLFAVAGRRVLRRRVRGTRS